MKRKSFLALSTSILVICLAPALGADSDKKAAASVVVSFGAGLNTAQPGNAANHHVLPKMIKVRTGGVVNFAVSGLHWVRVYNPGKKLSDVNVATGTAFVIDDQVNLFYDGINPGGPTGAPPSSYPLSNARNRIEGVSFPKAGTYLVICTIRPHFNDGMYAYVKVSDSDGDEEAEAVEAGISDGRHH